MEITGSMVIAAFGLILTVLNIIDKVANMKKNADEPQKVLNERINVLEIKVEEHTRLLQAGNDAFREQRVYVGIA